LSTKTLIPSNELAQIKTICILGWGLIGDVFIRIALLEAIKERFPESKLTVVVDPASVVALENHPAIDEVFVFSRKKKPVFKYFSTVIKSILILRRRKFDLCVNLYSGGASPKMTRLINARLRLGFNHTKALRKANNIHVDHPSLCENWTLAFGTILAPLGITNIRQGTSYFCSQESLAFAKQWLSDKPKKMVVLNLGTGAKEKNWPIHNFVTLAKNIQDRYSYHPVVLTNPGQAHLVEEFASEAKGDLQYSVLPLEKFSNVAAIIKTIGLIITGDTSIMHLAFGLKCPTLGIFTYTRPEIVDPVDCIHIACFEPGLEVDECGNKFGTSDLSSELCFSKFEELVTLLERT